MINTEILSKTLDNFALSIKITNEDYQNLRNRRDNVISLVKNYAKDNYNLSIIDQFNVGSYKIKTGVQRNGKNGWAFDIDYALVFNEEFDYEPFKNNLTNWLRDKVKEQYKENVIVSNRKKVLTIAFRDIDNNRTMYYLDIAFYIQKNDGIHHVARDENNTYNLTLGQPKETYKRQNDALAEENQNKRNSILILKYLKSKNRIKGASSIFITDSIIDASIELDTFALTKKFIEDNTSTNSFKLKEAPFSELIENDLELSNSLTAMQEKFFSQNSTLEVYKAMNQWLDNKLPNLDYEELENRNERYSGG